MRLNILLCVSFLATLAAGLVIPSKDVEARDLDVREGLVDDVANFMVFKREPKSSNAKKARVAAAKQGKAANKASFQAAAKAHKQTTNLPGRHSTFHVAGAPGKPAQTYTGKEVRKAVFDGHMEAQKVKKISKTQAKKSPMKNFMNRQHVAPKAHSGGLRPLNHMRVDPTGNNPHTPPGREFPLPNQHGTGPGPARVITQKTKAGHHTFRGVVGHDQSRPPTSAGYMDHFQVKERKPSRRTVGSLSPSDFQ